MVAAALDAHQLAGQLVLLGFHGLTLPRAISEALESGACGGVVLFRRNLAPGLDGLVQLQRLCREIVARCPRELPPFIAIDEEGGRVARLQPPALRVPALRELTRVGGAELVGRVARVHGRELSCLGINLNFAPVVDVDTNPQNPVIGDRSPSSDPGEVVGVARAYLRGLRAQRVAGCLKHFPGHGDTHQDSHLALPYVRHGRARLHAVELVPFATLANEAEAIMTAHVVFDALDPSQPATLSPGVTTALLREQLGFSGLVISDDLDMQAIAQHTPIAEAAPRAIGAGCDLLLCCQDAQHQREALAALSHRMGCDAAFRQRAVSALERNLALRRRYPARGSDVEGLHHLISHHVEPLQLELDRHLEPRA